MTIAIRQLHKHFVGEVSGLDLRQPLTEAEAREIEAAMDKYAVLVFHDQDITDEQQMAFALNFGQREDARGGTVTKEKDYRLQSGLNDVSNLGKGRQAAGKGQPRAPVQPRQLLVAFRQLVPPYPGKILAAVGPRAQPEGRQYRIRRHAGGL
ncbi:hypothetical protein ACVWXL_008747 [Bradyrhizobium sp. GM22.5]